VDAVPDPPYFSENMVGPEIESGISESVARNYDHYATYAAVYCTLSFIIRLGVLYTVRSRKQNTDTKVTFSCVGCIFEQC
jgi:hypothetical protein